jgi:CRP-like cAMP-binding protein
MIGSDTLQRFSLFVEVEQPLLEELSAISREKTISKGEWLFHEGDKADALYLVIHGRVELKLKLDEKRNLYITVTTLSEGDALGWSAIVEPYVYTLGALALDHVKLLRLDGENLRLLLEKHPEQGYILMRNIAKDMGTRVSVLSERVPDLSWRSILSTLLLVLGILSGIMVLLLGLSAILSTFGGYAGAAQALPVALFCLIFPAAFLFFARMIYPAKPRELALENTRVDSGKSVG